MIGDRPDAQGMTPNMRMILSYMDEIGGNPLSYGASQLAKYTGMKPANVRSALNAMYTTHNVVERVQTSNGILWRKVISSGS